MLTQLKISGFAIIDELDIEFTAGMSCLTGETGAGKSILLDALALVLGGRAEAGSVRQTAKRADISASFQIENLGELQQLLQDLELDAGNECLIRRVIRAEGGSKAYVNGQLVNSHTLKHIGEYLVDIHGQHAHQALLQKSKQRERLDAAGNLDSELSAVQQCYQNHQQASKALQKLASAQQQWQAQSAFLDFQISAFAEADVQAGEWQQISNEHQRLAHAENFLSKIEQAEIALADGEEFNIGSILSQQINNLESIAKLDSSLEPILNTLNDALINCQEAHSSLQAYASNIELDPERLQFIDARMAKLHALAKKHNIAPETLPDFYANLLDEREKLGNSAADLKTLESQVANLHQQYLELSAVLHHSRQQAASKLATAISESMAVLGMQGGSFVIAVHRDMQKISPFGQDDVEMLVSTNPGMAPKSLHKVASGGELSRISLAIQMITKSAERVPTLIFDEVDAGIGGGIAQIVGEQLRALANNRQVLCVTHLAQVACCAHQHYLVSKNKTDTTNSHIDKLDQQQRINETARMLGGIEISQATLDHATEMLAKAAQ